MDSSSKPGTGPEERDLVAISAEPLSQEKITEFVTDASAGAVSLFMGTYICY